MKQASFSFVAGILLCNQIRNYLRALKFTGADIEVLEGSGWLERRWTIRGDHNDVTKAYNEIAAWVKKNQFDT